MPDTNGTLRGLQRRTRTFRSFAFDAEAAALTRGERGLIRLHQGEQQRACFAEKREAQIIERTGAAAVSLRRRRNGQVLLSSGGLDVERMKRAADAG